MEAFMGVHNIHLDSSCEEYKRSLEALSKDLERNSTLFVNKNYQGHMNYAVSRPSADALLISLPFNQNQVATESSFRTTEYEMEFVSQMRILVGYSHDSWGYISSGGTASNIVALWIAKEKARAKGSRDNIVLGSTATHYSVMKACKLLDLVFVSCETDPNTGSVILPPSLTGVLAVVVNVGTTETGTVDDVDQVLKSCKEKGIFVHADAAYGGYYLYLLGDEESETLLSKRTLLQLAHIKYCDSVSIDPHKLGYAPYGAGLFLLKNGTDRKYINCTKNINYISSEISSSTTLEGSRSGSIVTSVYFGHMHMKSIYPKIMKKLIKGSLKFKECLKREGFVVYEPTDLGIVFFKPDVKDIPIEYYILRFCDAKNQSEDKIMLVSNDISGIGKHFRVVIMDPNFVDYCEDFISKLKKELDNYTADYEIFVNKRFMNLKSIAEECDAEEELLSLLKSCKKFTAYNGFEPSGRIHIAQALVTVMNTNAIIENGGKMIIYIADWFAQLNHKMGGDLQKIREVGRYFIEVFKSCGMKIYNTEFIWASEFINGNPNYLPRVLDISTKNSLSRIKRCCQIMGRKEGDELSSSQIIYPCMQCADIFELGIDICQLGVDQRKVNMLAREYAKVIKVKAPIILSHHMLMGLKGPGNKMSKSDPNSAIFVEDSEEEVISKIMKAFCDDKIEGNPIFDYIKHIVLRWFGNITLCNKEYSSIDLIANDFGGMDKKMLKTDVANYINKILDPVRRHFKTPGMKELAERVASYRVTK